MGGGNKGTKNGTGSAAFFDEVFGFVHRLAERCDGRGAMGIVFEASECFDGVLDVGEHGPGQKMMEWLAGLAGECEEAPAAAEERGESLAILR
jgi:hypothetical protein